MGLEQYFSAEVWQRFHDILIEEWNTSPDSRKQVLDGLGIPDDIKLVAIVRLGDGTKDWFLGRIPALERERPIDLVTHPEGANAVRECLMRMKD